jgi:hypothetical protein
MHEFSNVANDVRAKTRRRILGVAAVATAIFFGKQAVADRGTSARCIAAIGLQLDRDLQAAEKQVGLEVISILRDVAVLPPTELPESVTRLTARPPAVAARSAFLTLVESLAAVETTKRNEVVRSLLNIATAMQDPQFMNMLHGLAKLPAHVTRMVLEDDGAVFTTLAVMLQDGRNVREATDQIRRQAANDTCKARVVRQIEDSCRPAQDGRFLSTR